MKNLLKISITTLGTLAIFGTSTFAVTTGTVNAPSGLVLREEASKSGNPIITVPDKTTVNIIEDNGEWYKVKYETHEGYIFAEYVEAKQEDESVVPEIPTAEQQNDTQITGKLKIYNMPLITSTVIGELEQHAEIKVLKQITNWSYISAGEIQGWARTYVVEGGTQTENTVNTETTNKTDTNSEEIQTESKAEETTNEGETQETPEAPETEPKTPSNTEQTEQASTVKKGFIAVDSATVRKDATTSSDVVTYLIKGTSFEIQAETEEWYKIKYTDIDDVVYEGYIYKELVTT